MRDWMCVSYTWSFSQWSHTSTMSKGRFSLFDFLFNGASSPLLVVNSALLLRVDMSFATFFFIDGLFEYIWKSPKSMVLNSSGTFSALLYCCGLLFKLAFNCWLRFCKLICKELCVVSRISSCEAAFFFLLFLEELAPLASTLSEAACEATAPTSKRLASLLTSLGSCSFKAQLSCYMYNFRMYRKRR